MCSIDDKIDMLENEPTPEVSEDSEEEDHIGHNHDKHGKSKYVKSLRKYITWYSVALGKLN